MVLGELDVHVQRVSWALPEPHTQMSTQNEPKTQLQGLKLQNSERETWERERLRVIEFGDDFLDMTPRVQAAKEKLTTET